MVGLPRVIDSTGPSAIASYNYTDIAEGTGVRIFYAFTSNDNSGTDYHLSSQSAIFSSSIEIKGTTQSTSFVTVIDVDFDLSDFNLPQTVKGTAIINLPVAVKSFAAGATAKFTATVNHFDGTTETSLGTATGSDVTVGSGANASKIECFIISLTEKHFKKGETLRLSIKAELKKNSGSGNNEAYIGSDPKDRDGTHQTVSTQTVAHIPFKLNL